MRIAQISPLYESVPPRLYGGTERIVAYLADALTDLGHEVTLFASGDSHTKAELVPVRDQAIRLDPYALKSDLADHLAMLDQVRQRADEFDVLHFHTDVLHFPLFEDMAARTLTTIHGRLDLKGLAKAYRRWPQFPLVSISDQQRKPLHFANWISTVHHGLPDDVLRPAARPAGDYLAFLGRISPEKRCDRAIEVAKQCGMRLKIAAKIDAGDRAYYEERIEPLIDGRQIVYIGEINEHQKSEFLGNAAALLFLIDWPEPFGLTMIESMACGTPVVGWRCGSVPEVIESGVTGEVVDTEDQAVEAVKRVIALKRHTIREAWELRFSAKIMARKYVTLYERAPAASALTTEAAARLAVI